MDRSQLAQGQWTGSTGTGRYHRVQLVQGRLAAALQSALDAENRRRSMDTAWPARNWAPRPEAGLAEMDSSTEARARLEARLTSLGSKPVSRAGRYQLPSRCPAPARDLCPFPRGLPGEPASPRSYLGSYALDDRGCGPGGAGAGAGPARFAPTTGWAGLRPFPAGRCSAARPGPGLP